MIPMESSLIANLKAYINFGKCALEEVTMKGVREIKRKIGEINTEVREIKRKVGEIIWKPREIPM